MDRSIVIIEAEMADLSAGGLAPATVGWDESYRVSVETRFL
jgi:hypothetical protein